MEKIDDFDLIIFDRYKRRGILPRSYLENIARYVRDGGAILVAAGLISPRQTRFTVHRFRMSCLPRPLRV